MLVPFLYLLIVSKSPPLISAFRKLIFIFIKILFEKQIIFSIFVPRKRVKMHVTELFVTLLLLRVLRLVCLHSARRPFLSNKKLNNEQTFQKSFRNAENQQGREGIGVQP